MAVNLKSSWIADVKKSAAELATTESKTPYLNFMASLILARHHAEESGLGDDKDTFDDFMKSIGVDASNRQSEQWSVVKLGALQCAPVLVANIKKCNFSRSSLYYAACGVRATGFFAASNKAGLKALGGEKGWNATVPTAPTQKQLQDCVDAAYKHMNRKKVAVDTKSIDDYIAGVVKTLKRYNEKGFSEKKKGGKVIRKATAALNNPNLTTVIAALADGAWKVKPSLKVIKGGKSKAA
jgi:hypothetical protein